MLINNPGVTINQVEQSNPYHSPVPGLFGPSGDLPSQLKESTHRDIQSAEAIPQQWIPEVLFTSATGKDPHEQEIIYPLQENQKPEVGSGIETIMEPGREGRDTVSTGRFYVGNTNKAIFPGENSHSSFEDTQPVDLKFHSESGIPNTTLPPVLFNPAEMVEYSFLMISNNPEFRMVGEVEEIIGEEILDICQVNGWNLLFLLIHSDYLQLTVSVPSTMPPGIIIRVFRENTTKKIMEGFEEMDVNIVQGDFWVKGYLVTDGKETEI